MCGKRNESRYHCGNEKGPIPKEHPGIGPNEREQLLEVEAERHLQVAGQDAAAALGRHLTELGRGWNEIWGRPVGMVDEVVGFRAELEVGSLVDGEFLK